MERKGPGEVNAFSQKHDGYDKLNLQNCHSVQEFIKLIVRNKSSEPPYLLDSCCLEGHLES